MAVQKICPQCSREYRVAASILRARPIEYCSMACKKEATKNRNANHITIEYLKSRMKYDPETGLFSRKKVQGCPESNDAGWVDPMGYKHIRISGHLYLAHRLAWMCVHGEMPTENIDHKNGNPGDNRISNIRIATQQQNTFNSKIIHKRSSVRKGVCYRKERKRYQAYIRAWGKWRHLGYFISKEDAVSARCAAEKIYHGEFARAA